jgi:hypothetical protein
MVFLAGSEGPTRAVENATLWKSWAQPRTRKPQGDVSEDATPLQRVDHAGHGLRISGIEVDVAAWTDGQNRGR